MDSSLSDNEQQDYKKKINANFKLFSAERELNKISFESIKRDIPAHEIVYLAINKFFDENEDKLPIFIDYI